MEELLSRMSSYNLLNNFFNGAIFSILMFRPENIEQLVGNSTYNILVVYYSLGLVLYHMGSMFIEPLYKYLEIVKYADYLSYLKAEKIDDKITSMVEENNFYRTLVVTFIVLFISSLFVDVRVVEWVGCCKGRFMLLALSCFFSYAYRKRTGYIRRRVENCVQNREEEYIGKNTFSKCR